MSAGAAPVEATPSGGRAGRREEQRRRRTGQRRELRAAVGCGLLAAAATAVVVWPGLDNELFRDEAVTADIASRTPVQVLDLLGTIDAGHAQLYLLASLLPIDPSSATQLRLLALIPMMIAGALLAGWSWLRLGPASGLLAALTWPLMPATVGVSLYARDYGLATLFVTAATLVLMTRLLEPSDPPTRARRWWIGYGVLLCAAAWSNLFALLVVPAHAVVVLLRWRAARASGSAEPAAVAAVLRVWGVAVGAAIVGALPLVLAVALQPTPINWVAPPLRADLVIIPERILGGSAYGTADAPQGAGLLALVLVVGMALAVLRARRAEGAAPRVAALTGAAWFVVPLVAAFLISFVQPIFVARYLWFVAPAVVLLLATLVSPLTELPPPGRRAAAVRGGSVVGTVLLVVALLLALGAAPRAAVGAAQGDADYRGAQALIAQQAQAGDVLVVDDPEFLFARSGLLAAGGGRPLPVPEVLVVVPAAEAGRLAPVERPPEEWLSTLRDAPRVWVLTNDAPGPGPRETLAAGLRERTVDERFGGLLVKRYDRVQETDDQGPADQG